MRSLTIMRANFLGSGTNGSTIPQSPETSFAPSSRPFVVLGDGYAFPAGLGRDLMRGLPVVLVADAPELVLVARASRTDLSFAR